jgi:putative hydrolase of the HAD superfamily
VDIVFDFGNVLVEWNPLQLVNDHFVNHLAPFASASDFMALWMNDAWAAYDRGDIDSVTVVESMARTMRCQPEPLLTFIEKIPHVLSPMRASIDSLETLAAARNSGAAIRVFYLSNMPREFADVLETRFDWINLFDGGIFSGREGVSKPDEAIYTALESRYSLTPSTTLFFDDVDANIEAARSRGWHAIEVKTPGDVTDALQARGLLH